MTKSLCDSCVNKNCRWRAETVSNDPPVMDCTDFKTKITNADKIRAMTDEELVVMLGEMGHDYPPYCQGRVTEEFCGKINYDCRVCCAEWLKQEVTENV